MDEFERFSADIGRRIDLVQGAGGNTSIKADGRMRIKASGAWLAEALDKPIFVDVDLSAMRAALVGDFDDATLKATLASEADLRPSIETPLHALSPFRIVAHVHSANAIAWSVRKDARERLAERLAGLEWAFIPYVRPGAPLAKAVRDAFKAGKPSVLVLGNHGLVVAADAIDDLRALLDDVEARLARSENSSGEIIRAERPSPPPGFHWRESGAWEALARDEARRNIAAGGSLYPDHVVFLGPSIILADSPEEIATMIPPPKAAIVKDAGLLARADLSKGALAMIDCLGLVLERLDPGAPVNYLSAEDEAALLGWDAEAHRQALDKRQART